MRVKREVEELVRQIAEETALAAFTVRNLAILYGLRFVRLAKLPETDEEFVALLNQVKEELGYGEEEEKKEG